MQQFFDSSGRRFEVIINVGTIKRVKTTLKIDLTDQSSMVNDVPLLSALEGQDLFTLVDVLHDCCIASVREHGLNAEGFAEALSGEALASAQAALMQELEDFFRGLGRQETVKAIQTSRKLAAKRIAKQTQIVEAAGDKIEARIDQLSLDAISGLESLASTPTASLPES